MAGRRCSAPGRDRGGIVLGWLVKLTSVLAVLAIVVFDAMSISTARLSIQDQGGTAARAASEAWARSQDARTALDAAISAATTADPANTVDPASFLIEPNGTVRLTLTREVPTLVVGRIGPLQSWTVVRANSWGRSDA